VIPTPLDAEIAPDAATIPNPGSSSDHAPVPDAATVPNPGSTSDHAPVPDSATVPEPAPIPSATARYDLVYVRARRWDPGRPRTASLLQLDFEFEGSSLSLEAARGRRRAVDRHGTTALIVPERYRAAGLALADAARLAAESARRAEPELHPEPPRFHADHPMFFTFVVPFAGAGGTPAGPDTGLLVSVDKGDGHIWTDQEMGDYFDLIGPR